VTVVEDRPSTATGPTVRSTARSARGPVLLLLAIVVTAVVVGVLSLGGPSGRLDPDSAAPSGAKALAQVLRDSGVQVRRVETVEQVVEANGPEDTVVIGVPAALADSELEQLGAQASALVVVGAEDDDLDALGLPAAVEAVADVEALRPGCDLAVAETAGTAELGGLAYRADDGTTATGCYATAGSAHLLRLPSRGVTLLGDGAFLTNAQVDEEGNAALAMGLLAERGGEVLWLVPRPGRAVPAGDQPSLTELLPDGLLLGAWQLAIAVAVLALWRARRLGRVVEEPLPVVVRAAEAVEGRSRLYRAAHARGSAAESLRVATRLRLARAAGLPVGTARTSLVPVVAERAGRSAADVDAVLYGGAPTDDAALVRLVGDLRSLETASTTTPPIQEVAGP
jgi:hypothetical protein